MIQQTKKLRLDELQVDSFVTSSINDSATVKGGITLQGICVSGMPPACPTATQTNPGDVVCATGDFLASCPFCATVNCPPSGAASCHTCVGGTCDGNTICYGGTGQSQCQCDYETQTVQGYDYGC